MLATFTTLAKYLHKQPMGDGILSGLFHAVIKCPDQRNRGKQGFILVLVPEGESIMAAGRGLGSRGRKLGVRRPHFHLHTGNRERTENGARL